VLRKYKLKIPKTKKTYCKYCKKQTEHTISIAKKRERGTLRKGSLARLKNRGSGRSGFGNHGKFSRKAISAFKRTGVKTSKKSDLRLKCKVCNKSTVKSGLRTKRLSIEDKS
jgi:large subunit ribosomal protein L44e